MQATGYFQQIKIIITKESKENAAQKLWGALPSWKTSSDELEKYGDKEFETMPNVEFVK